MRIFAAALAITLLAYSCYAESDETDDRDDFYDSRGESFDILN
jgi:hypothetical protein